MAALNTHGWDGAWYRRAYYDNGQPLGSKRSDECQIDALAQAWAVLSGVAPADRAGQAHGRGAGAAGRSQDAGIIKLLTPPFNRTPHDPGYIKGYLPGIRENGGQYTHGVLWVVRALAEMGRGTTAVELLRMLSPVWHTATRGARPRLSNGAVRGGSGCLRRAAARWPRRLDVVHRIGRLDVSRRRGIDLRADGRPGATLVIKPAISAAWPQCRLTYRLPGESTCYEIRIENPQGKEQGVTSASVDGEDVAVDCGAVRVPLVHDGGAHRVVSLAVGAASRAARRAGSKEQGANRLSDSMLVAPCSRLLSASARRTYWMINFD